MTSSYLGWQLKKHDQFDGIQHLVSPKLPTALANNACVDLPGHDLNLSLVNVVYVIPTELDVSKFEDALSRVLQLYPHAAGRLRCAAKRWFIELTNTAVPVEVDQAPGVNSSSFLDGEWFIQHSHNLSPLLPIGPKVVGANDDVPLLRVKMTFFDRETSIGITWHHSLGDGNTLWRFIHMSSQIYQSLPLQYAAPSFEKYHFPAPSRDMDIELSSRMPLYRGFFQDDMYFTPQRDLSEVRWRFSRHELEELRSALNLDKQNKTSSSKQDCLTAYLVAVLNLHRSDPLHVMRIVTSYRHVQASFVQENVAGNLVLFAPVGVPRDMARLASAIRDAVTETRDPDLLYILETLKSEYWLNMANAGAWRPILLRGNLFVNAIGMDWWSAHFGCPDRIQVYLSGIHMNWLKCSKSNPVKGKDGTWKTPETIDISVGVPAELKPKVMETLARGIHYMLDKEHLRSRL